jgi:hypothetical protein
MRHKKEMYIEFKDPEKTRANRKVLSVVGRGLKHVETGESVLTFQDLADSLGYADRRNVRGLKHQKAANTVRTQLSRPSRARGLKPCLLGSAYHLIQVAPFAGAWIEKRSEAISLGNLLISCQHNEIASSLRSSQ